MSLDAGVELPPTHDHQSHQLEETYAETPPLRAQARPREGEEGTIVLPRAGAAEMTVMTGLQSRDDAQEEMLWIEIVDL